MTFVGYLGLLAALISAAVVIAWSLSMGRVPAEAYALLGITQGALQIIASSATASAAW